MRPTTSIATAATSLIQLRFSSETVVLGTVFVCLSKAAEPEGCSLYLQKTLLHGGVLFLCVSAVAFVVAVRADIVALFASLNEHTPWCQIRSVRAVTWICLGASVANYFAPYYKDDPYHTDIIITVLILLVVSVTIWYDHKLERSDDDHD